MNGLQTNWSQQIFLEPLEERILPKPNTEMDVKALNQTYIKQKPTPKLHFYL